MRQVAKISGIITTIMVVLGISMKLIHFPGGSILVILGVGAFVAVCLTSLMYYKRQIANSRLERVEAGLSWFAGSVLAVGLLFAIQHWPGGPQFLIGIFLSVIFLIIHFKVISTYENDRKMFGVFDVIVVVMFAMLFIGRFFAMGRAVDTQKFIAEYNELRVTESKQQEENSNEFVNFMNATQKDTAKESVYSTMILIHEKTQKLFDYVMDMRGKLVELSAGLPENHTGDTLRIELLDHPSDFDTPTHFMIGADPSNVTGEAKPLKENLIKFYDEVNKILPEQSQKEFKKFVTPFLPAGTTIIDKDGSMTSTSWEQENFYHKTVIETLTTLEQIEINILKAESEAFKQIQNSTPTN